MTRTEHLKRIKARCKSLISNLSGAPKYAEAIAGWKSTIAAIEGLTDIYEDTEGFADGSVDASAFQRQCNSTSSMAYNAINSIISAWPEELL